MSWQSPDRNSRRSNPLSEDDKVEASANVPLSLFTNQEFRPSVIQQQPQQQFSIEETGESIFPRGGINSPQSSRLAGYTSGMRRPFPQSYPSDQPFSQFHSPSNQSLTSNYEIPSFGLTDEQQSAWPFSLPHNASSPTLRGSPPPRVSRQHQLQELQSWDINRTIGSSPLASPFTPQRTGNFIRTDSSHPQIQQHSSVILPSILNLEPRFDTTHTPTSTSGGQHPPFSYTGTLGEIQDAPTQTQSFDASQSGTAPSSSTTSGDDLKSPLPQNLRGDPFRSAKVKTELCRYFNTEKGCLFGDKCNYAHGENELKFNKLIDLENAGLVDIEVFRTHPCFTWVATGACPFDQRCTRLHDPRVNGLQPSWLPHAEVLVNNVGRGLHVDKMYHQQFCAVYSCSPIYGFAPKRRWRADEASTSSAWKEFYTFCCNMENGQPYSKGKQWPLTLQQSEDSTASQRKPTSSEPPELSEMNRLAIALKMRERKMARYYTFLPSHVFCTELCMVLQTCYFKLESVEGQANLRQSQVVEISEQEYTTISQSENVISSIIAREIAFGPVADASVRQPAIWFNVPADDIVPCTRQQARRHKRSRHRLRSKRNVENQPEEVKISSSCSIPPFYSCQPVDEAAFDLVTGIQTHRYRVLEYFSSSHDDQVIRALASEEEHLRKCFESQRRFWMTWTWPKKTGCSNIDDETDVPPVDGAYSFAAYGDRGYGEDAIFFGVDQQDSISGPQVISNKARLTTGLLWKSFVMNLQLLSNRGAIEVPADEENMPSHDPIIPQIRRLSVLRKLSLGLSIVRHTRILPKLNTQLCSSTSVNVSLDILIREWTAYQLQLEENSTNPLREAQIGKDNPPDSTRRRSLSYSLDAAATSWTRALPKYS